MFIFGEAFADLPEWAVNTVVREVEPKDTQIQKGTNNGPIKTYLIPLISDLGIMKIV